MKTLVYPSDDSSFPKVHEKEYAKNFDCIEAFTYIS